MNVDLRHGDCLAVMAELPNDSVHAIVCDPPYGLGFMGKAWDDLPPGLPWAQECLRVLKPGGHLLAFGGTRTWHRLACAVEDAGFEMRDSIAWLYGSGFPKSLDVSKAIDKRPGVERHPEFAEALKAAMKAKGYTNTFDVAERVVGRRTGAVANWQKYQFPEAKWWPALRDLLGMDGAVWDVVIAEAERTRTGQHKSGLMTGTSGVGGGGDGGDITAPATETAQQWQGWGTALKPAFEPIVVARKPLALPIINVLSRVESELKARGVTEVRWSESVSGAGRPETQPSSSSIQPQPAVATSVAHAVASETLSDEKPTDSASATSTPLGELPTASTPASTPATATDNFVPKSSQLMEAPAPAVTNARLSSLPSITSMEAEPLTAKPRGGRSTRKSSAKDSRVVTESFAGIATGLTGSLAAVRIDRLNDGSYIWPEGLPTSAGGGAATVAQNVLVHGTGALNVDGCRIGTDEDTSRKRAVVADTSTAFGKGLAMGGNGHESGRWPANVVLDEDQAAALDAQSGMVKGATSNGKRKGNGYGENYGEQEQVASYGDTGGASRFFYVAKAPKRERPVVWMKSCNCETMKPCQSQPRATTESDSGDATSWNTSTSGSRPTDPSRQDTTSTTETATSSTTTSATSSSSPSSNTSASTPAANFETVSGGSPAQSVENSNPSPSSTGTSAPKAGPSTAAVDPATSNGWSETSVCGNCGAPARKIVHETVKPLALMRWLVRLVTPPGGTVLEPFAGSGATVEAAILEGMGCIAIEREAEYLPLIRQRIERAEAAMAVPVRVAEPDLFS